MKSALFILLVLVYLSTASTKLFSLTLSADSLEFQESVYVPPVFNFKEIYEELEYPELAKQFGVEGNIKLRVKIDKDGDVEEVVCIEKFFDVFIEPAIKAVKDVEHTPATIDGEAIGAEEEVWIFFRLKGFDYRLQEKTSSNLKFESYANYEKTNLLDSVSSSQFVGVESEPYFDMNRLMKNIIYPEYCLRRNITGQVVLRCYIDSIGLIQKVRVLISPHPDLSKAAENAIRITPIKPARTEKGPIGIWLDVPFDFRID